MEALRFLSERRAGAINEGIAPGYIEAFLHWRLTEVHHEDAKGAKVWF
jgi:hypothetical protein